MMWPLLGFLLLLFFFFFFLLGSKEGFFELGHFYFNLVPLHPHMYTSTRGDEQWTCTNAPLLRTWTYMYTFINK